jgi:hypothetical protein
MALQGSLGPGPYKVEFVIELEPLPVLQTEVADDELLPVALVGCGCVAEAQGYRDRTAELFTAGHVDSQGEEGRGVSAAREGHQARCTLERRDEGQAQGGSRTSRACRAEGVLDAVMPKGGPDSHLERPGPQAVRIGGAECQGSDGTSSAVPAFTAVAPTGRLAALLAVRWPSNRPWLTTLRSGSRHR